MNGQPLPSGLHPAYVPPEFAGFGVSIWPFTDCGPWWTNATPWLLMLGALGAGVAIGAFIL